MEHHIALYRKWRPATFGEVVGQDHVTRTLRYEVRAGRVSHAYLFSGSRGTGKTTCAKILAKAVNCLCPVDGEPCGVCENCRLVASGLATDIVEMDAASNTGVDYIRDIRDEVVYSPAALKMRVYIIDEVHMLTDSAANALLKTLEEPPEGVLFILATTEPHKLPATVLSRCQCFDFRRLPTDTIASRLRFISKEEGIDLDPAAARLIARGSRGGMRDAIGLLELCAAGGERVDTAAVERVTGSAGKETVERTVRAILAKDGGALLATVGEITRSSGDITVFWEELLAFVRDIVIVKYSLSRGEDERAAEDLRRDLLDATEAEMAVLRELSSEMTFERLMALLRQLSDAYAEIARAVDKRLPAEMALLRLTLDRLDSSPDALLHRVAVLEDALAAMRAAPSPANPAPAAPPAARAAEAPTENTAALAAETPGAMARAAGTPTEKAAVAEMSATEEPGAPASALAEDNPATTAAPAAREISNFPSIARAVCERVKTSSPAFAGALLNARGGSIDAEGIAHIRTRDKLQLTFLRGDKAAAQALAREITSQSTPVRGVVFDLAEEDAPATLAAGILDGE